MSGNGNLGLTDPTVVEWDSCFYNKEERNKFELKSGLAQSLRGGVIMDVTNVEQAIIAEKSGAVSVMALERIPADIREHGGIARMSDPQFIMEIKRAVSIPVMAKVRIGHFVEAQILESIKIDFIDESEVLTPADKVNHINKKNFTTPFVCGARDLGEALRRISEGAAMIRTKGEAGTGNIVHAVTHARTLLDQINQCKSMSDSGLYSFAKSLNVPYNLVLLTKKLGRLPVINFSAGGVATPADAALMMQLGLDGVFVGSGIFKSSNPRAYAEAIVRAVANYDSPHSIADSSKGIGTPMFGTPNDKLVPFSDR